MRGLYPSLTCCHAILAAHAILPWLSPRPNLSGSERGPQTCEPVPSNAAGDGWYETTHVILDPALDHNLDVLYPSNCDHLERIALPASRSRGEGAAGGGRPYEG